MSKSSVNSARLAALSMLGAVLDKATNLGDAEGGLLLADPRDRAQARHLAYGVTRWLTALDWLAHKLLQKPLRQRDQDIHRLILLGLFELWKGGSSPHAAINETTESARKLGKTWAVAVINAVLRRFQREQEAWLKKLDSQEERFAHPDWLLRQLKADWPDDWMEIMKANNHAAPLWLRLNQNHAMSGTIVALGKEGFSVDRHPLIPGAVKIFPAAAVNALPGFSQGLFSVQDPAAQLAADLLEVSDNLRILDACAAPGGKTCHILECAPGAALTALDRSTERLALIAENIKRLGLGDCRNVKLLAADAAKPDTWWDGLPFDRILLDAPCSATGVIRRHPEIKWLRSSQQVRNAINMQSCLLDRLWPLLKPGGILLYATCSVLKDENSRQIRQFVERQTDAKPIDLAAKWGRELEFGRQILPGDQEMDGFYYAVLHKHA